MANPAPFDDSNRELTAPEGVSEDEVGTLPVWTDGAVCISCWELTGEELMEILQTKRVWVRVYSGASQPPIMVHTENPFIYDDEEEDEMP
jgi:hypothetical protein